MDSDGGHWSVKKPCFPHGGAVAKQGPKVMPVVLRGVDAAVDGYPPSSASAATFTSLVASLIYFVSRYALLSLTRGRIAGYDVRQCKDSFTVLPIP